MTREAINLLLAAVMGAACACLYDFFRGVHRLMRGHDVTVIITDALYWFIVTAGVIYYLLAVNNMAIHLYEILGTAIGAALYILMLSPYIYRFFAVIIEKTAKIIRYILKILLTPLKFLYKISIAFLFSKLGLKTLFKTREKVIDGLHNDS